MTTTYNTILWDWNGTLLNDVTESIDSINELLSKRNMPTITVGYYKEIFCFPVIDYYKKLNFNFEKELWKKVAAEFMASYHAKEHILGLFDDSLIALEHFKSNGYKQYILSAMKKDSIIKMTNNLGITHYFNGIYGLDNHYANGKIDLGFELLSKENLSPQNCLMIGDTTHDAEVADAIKCKAALISQGHQNYEILKNTGHSSYHNLESLIKNISK